MIAVAPAAFAQIAEPTAIGVAQAWARAAPAGARTGAVHLTISDKANTADRLTGAFSDVAAKIQIHEMAVANGIMHMRRLVGGRAIAAGASATLKPGSFHVMLIGLKKPLAQFRSRYR
jgi:copper(I)-binding protein